MIVEIERSSRWDRDDRFLFFMNYLLDLAFGTRWWYGVWENVGGFGLRAVGTGFAYTKRGAQRKAREAILRDEKLAS